MSKLRVSCFTVSLDGYGAGPDQDEQNPLGRDGMDLHRWLFPTRTFQSMHGQDGEGTTGVDDDFARRGHREHRRLDPRAQHVRPRARPLARRALERLVGREPALPRAGVRADAPRAPRRWRWRAARRSTSSPAASKRRSGARARRPAARDVRVGGGAATIRQYLRARLIDELHLAISPVLLGSGESLFEGIDMRALGYRVEEHVPTAAATHVVLRHDG